VLFEITAQGCFMIDSFDQRNPRWLIGLQLSRERAIICIRAISRACGRFIYMPYAPNLCSLAHFYLPRYRPPISTLCQSIRRRKLSDDKGELYEVGAPIIIFFLSLRIMPWKDTFFPLPPQIYGVYRFQQCVVFLLRLHLRTRNITSSSILQGVQ